VLPSLSIGADNSVGDLSGGHICETKSVVIEDHRRAVIPTCQLLPGGSVITVRVTGSAKAPGFRFPTERPV